MSGAEEIQITNQGYTDTMYAVCGDLECAITVLLCIGVSAADAAEPGNVSDLDIGNDVQVTVALLKESDSCEWCACCGMFIRHGLVYEGEDVGCTHDRNEVDPERLMGPHLNLIDASAMEAYWGTAATSHK